MLDGWLRVPLRKVTTKIGSGATPRGGKDAYRGGATALIRSQNVYNSGFVPDGLVYIDDVQADELHGVEVQADDVLLNITGDSVARVCSALASVLPARVNQHVAIIRTYPEVADPRYIRYWLASPAMQATLHALASAGATRPALTKGMIEGLECPLPPLPEQRAIAHTLSTLDDKIELNRQTNQTLEHIAAALFKSWFVDFDPVRAKAEGRQPEGMDAETAALFPDRLVESEIGEIPEGWQTAPVGEAITAVGGSTPSTAQSEYWGGDIPFATPKDLSKLDAPVLLTTERHITDAGLGRISSGSIPRHSLLMSSRAPIGYLAVNEVPVSVNQGMIVMVCDKGVSPWYMLGWARANLEEIIGRANGTTFLEISKRNFRPIPIVLPPHPILEQYDAVVGPLFARLTSNLKQNQTLSALRDLLLPKLLSGELRVPTVLLDKDPIAMPQPTDQPLVQSAF